MLNRKGKSNFREESTIQVSNQKCIRLPPYFKIINLQTSDSRSANGLGPFS